MEKFNEILTVLVSALGIMAVVMPFVVEFIKNMVTEKVVIKIFGVLERFCALVSAIAGVIVYVAIYVLMPEIFKGANFAQVIVIGAFFMGACAIASQIGYDKIIKWLINKK